MTAELHDPDQARHKLYDIMQRDMSFDAKVEAALELGRAYLGVENGHLTRIDPQSEYWEAIESTDDADGHFPPGLRLDLQTTYCRRAIEQEDPVVLTDAANQGWADDPAYRAHGLSVYLGTRLTVSDDIVGTVCFVSETARERPFEEDETMFVELIARMLEHELERQRFDRELKRHKNLVIVLHRILRHNLRNGLTVIRGQFHRLVDRMDDADRGTGDAIEAIDQLIELSEKARILESVVGGSTEREAVDLVEVTDAIAIELRGTYSDAEITLHTPTEAIVRTSPSIERAIREVMENATKHASPEATVTVSIEPGPTFVDLSVEDDGPGIPPQELRVFEEAAETPLVHGSGLGLWLMYWIVTGNGGGVSTTVTDDGTTVTLTIPTHSGEGSEPTAVSERELQWIRDRFDAVFRQAPVAMVIVDDRARVLDANAMAEDLFGFPSDELLGRSILGFTPEREDTDLHWQGFLDGADISGRDPIVRSDGSVVTVDYVGKTDVLPGHHLFVIRPLNGE